MRLTWNDSDRNRGRYTLSVYNEEDYCLHQFTIYDYTCKCRQELDKDNHVNRPYAYVVNGTNMGMDFCYDPEYDTRVDANGRYIGGYNGNCTMTLDEVKRWCEEYVAMLYIIDYDTELEKLKRRKEISDWFIANGYTGKVD